MQNPIDFFDPQFVNRFSSFSAKKEILAKAIGFKKNKNILVIDCTAGFGHESLLLAKLGCKVVMLERNLIIYNWLKEALEKASTSELFSNILPNIELVNICATQYLKSLPEHYFKEDLKLVIYCDPMFEPRKKSAKVKKSKQILQNIVGKDLDKDLLFKAALSIKNARIVLKQAILSQPILDPFVSWTNKHCRLDVYLN